jgi:hypothetical protein
MKIETGKSTFTTHRSFIGLLCALVLAVCIAVALSVTPGVTQMAYADDTAGDAAAYESQDATVQTQAAQTDRKAKIYKEYDSDEGSVYVLKTLYPTPGDTVQVRVVPKAGYTTTRLYCYYTPYIDPSSGGSYIDDPQYLSVSRVVGTGLPGTANTYEFTVPEDAANISICAEFATCRHAIQKNEVNATATIIADPSDSSATATKYPAAGQKVFVRINADEGASLTRASYTNATTGKTCGMQKVAGTTNVYSFTMPNADVTINAVASSAL